MVLHADAGGEVEGVGRPALAAAAELQRPQSRKDDGGSIFAEQAEEGSGLRIGGNVADAVGVVEIADQHVVAVGAEVAGRDGHAPRGGQVAARGEALVEGPVHVELVDEPGAQRRRRRARSAQGVGDPHVAAQTGDVEGEQAIGVRPGIGEGPGQGDVIEAGVEDVDRAGDVVGRVEEGLAVVGADLEARVGREVPAGAPTWDDRLGAGAHAVPAGDRPIEVVEDVLGRASAGQGEAGAAGIDDAGRPHRSGHAALGGTDFLRNADGRPARMPTAIIDAGRAGDGSAAIAAGVGDHPRS